MRSVVAQFWGGHPFEEKYVNLPHEKLIVLYLDALKSNKELTNAQYETYKAVLKNVSQAVENASRLNAAVVSPENYKHFREAEDLEKYRQEVPDEQFREEFNTMKDLGIIPEEVVIPLEGDDWQPPEDKVLELEGMKTFNFDDLKKAAEQEEE